MAQPEIYDLLGIPSQEESRTRSALSRPVSNYRDYYGGFESRRGPSTGIRSPQRVFSARDWQAAQARANYEQEARRALQGLSTIQPDDPELPYKQEEILYRSPYGRDLVKDPRVTGLIKTRTAESLRLQKQFQEDPESQTDYILARRAGMDPQSALGRAVQSSEMRKNRLWFAEKGGNLEDFDSGRFMQNGRFDRAAAQAYINQIPKKKDAEKPWQERLSFKEGEAIREASRAARDLTDFEEEFATVLKDNPTLTRDAYVKQFKNAPDFETYRRNRILTEGDRLMREYGLSRNEAASLLGIQTEAPVSDASAAPEGVRKGPEAMFEGVRGEPSNLAPTFEGRKDTGGTPGAPATAASPQVSPADLKRIDSLPGADAPRTFETLSQEVTAAGAAARKAREDERLAREETRETTKQADSALWENAKLKLLQGLSPQLAQTLSPSPTEAQFTEIFQKAGIDASKPAFTYPAQNGIPGRDVSWYEVLTHGLAQDPRIKQLQGEAPTAQKKSFSSLWGGS
jgi:hypothetical protein